jgi:hypothetical protein
MVRVCWVRVWWWCGRCDEDVLGCVVRDPVVGVWCGRCDEDVLGCVVRDPVVGVWWGV